MCGGNSVTNDQIADVLDQVADLLEFEGANPFRIRAYRGGSRVVRELDQVDFKEIFLSVEEGIESIHEVLTSPEIPATMESLADTMESLRKLSHTLNEKIGPFSDAVEDTALQADATLRELKDVIASVGVLIDPESPLAFQLGQTLRQVSGASDSLRELATFLEEHPSALLYGRDARPEEDSP